MIAIEPFSADHYDRLVLQNHQEHLRQFFTREHAQAVEKEPSFTALDMAGTVLGFGGIYTPWPGRAVLWAFVGANAGPHFVEIHRAVVRFLNTLPHRRIEATAQAGFAPSHRWLRMLGFHCETPDGMAAYTPDGQTHFQYARTRS